MTITDKYFIIDKHQYQGEYMVSVKENSRAMSVKSQIPRDNTFNASKMEVNC